MPAHEGEIESVFGVEAPQVRRTRLQYADIVVAVLGAFALAWTADQLTGRRGLFATSLVSGVAAVAGIGWGVPLYPLFKWAERTRR